MSHYPLHTPPTPRTNPQHIVLPEALDKRVLAAAADVTQRGLARITLLGDPVTVQVGEEWGGACGVACVCITVCSCSQAADDSAWVIEAWKALRTHTRPLDPPPDFTFPPCPAAAPAPPGRGVQAGPGPVGLQHRGPGGAAEGGHGAGEGAVVVTGRKGAEGAAASWTKLLGARGTKLLGIEQGGAAPTGGGAWTCQQSCCTAYCTEVVFRVNNPFPRLFPHACPPGVRPLRPLR